MDTTTTPRPVPCMGAADGWDLDALNGSLSRAINSIATCLICPVRSWCEHERDAAGGAADMIWAGEAFDNHGKPIPLTQLPVYLEQLAAHHRHDEFEDDHPDDEHGAAA